MDEEKLCPFRGRSIVVVTPKDENLNYELLEQMSEILNRMPKCVRSECAIWDNSLELCSSHSKSVSEQRLKP
jgi:hypothetical protein